MSRKYLNDKWCVRCGRKTPTPYLQKNIKLFSDCKTVLDIGCGNGRNSVFMLNNRYKVTSIDMCTDFGVKIMLGKDPIPEDRYDLVMANYVLMFLNQNERYQVYREIQKNTKIGSMLMVELYAAKDAFDYDLDKIIHYFKLRNWSVVRKSKDRCILRRN